MLANESIMQIFKHVNDLCKTIVDLDQYSARAKHIKDTIKKIVDCYGDILLDRQIFEDKIVQKLNKAGDCYKIKLVSEKQISVKSENTEPEKIEPENSEFENFELENVEPENLGSKVVVSE